MEYKPFEDHQLDAGIRSAVLVLRDGGIETFESCEGGDGHAYLEPTVRFHGDINEGYKAASIAIENNLPIAEVRRTWPLIDGELTGPYWEMTFRS